MTFYKFGTNIRGLNMGLMVSWAICSVWRIVISTFTSFDYGNVETVSLLWWIVEEINFIIFLSFMFKLKVIEIYMNPESSSESMQSSLKLLVKLMYLYFFLYLMIVVTQIFIWFKWSPEVLKTPSFAWTYAMLSVASFIIIVPTHVYLIIMALNT